VRDQWRRQEQSRVRDAHAICARRSDHDLGQLRSHHVSAQGAVPTTVPLKGFGREGFVYFKKNSGPVKIPVIVAESALVPFEVCCNCDIFDIFGNAQRRFEIERTTAHLFRIFYASVQLRGNQW
jgi:hypothetical protein